ncbi:MAG: thiamine pyrophosphate-binding protein [Chloroflexota bacterium]
MSTPTDEQGALSAAAVLESLDRCGITDVVWLPDSESGFLYQALSSRASPRLTPVCREGEAIVIALGLVVAGRRPAVIIQSTGLFESGDSIRGAAIAFQMPLLVLVGYRGWTGGGPLTDTAAIYLEPILNAWGIPHYLVESDADLRRVDEAWAEAQRRNGIAAVLVGQEYQ